MLSLTQQQIIGMDLEALREANSLIVTEIRRRQNTASIQMKSQLFVGMRVAFEDNSGSTIQGKVTKIMRKFARVETSTTAWRVPMNRLTKV